MCPSCLWGWEEGQKTTEWIFKLDKQVDKWHDSQHRALHSKERLVSYCSNVSASDIIKSWNQSCPSMCDGGDQPQNIEGARRRRAECFIMLTVGTWFSPYGVQTWNWKVVESIWFWLIESVEKKLWFWLSGCYWSWELWKWLLSPARRAHFFLSSLHLMWLWARCRLLHAFTAHPDWLWWLKKKSL